MTNARFVINSTDQNLTYCFFAPLVALLWKNRIQYSPLTLMVGSRQSWEASEVYRFVYETTKKQSEVVHLSTFPQFRSSTIAQISRLFASAIDLPSGSYLLTSDMDMLPFSKWYFDQQISKKKFHIFGSDAYRPEFRFPMCYLGASLATWREVMGIRVLDINRSLGVNLEPMRDEWNYDEEFFAEKLGRWSGYPFDCEFLQRGWPQGMANGRVDRADWKFDGKIDSVIDSHCVRPGYLWSNWQKIRLLLQASLSASDFEWAENYRADFVSLLRPSMPAQSASHLEQMNELRS